MSGALTEVDLDALFELTEPSFEDVFLRQRQDHEGWYTTRSEADGGRYRVRAVLNPVLVALRRRRR